MKELEKIFYGNIVAYDAAMLPEAKQDELQNVIWRQISSAKWHIIAIEVPQELVFLDMSNKQDICRDINPSNIQLDGGVMETSFLPHTPSNSRPENAMDAGGFTDLETSPVLPVCVKKDSETKKSPQRKGL
ncbi:uncharacterized protein LOC116136362 isoform X1 [Pistacia vera]|uniref:uncharacterized protein LOC116136362 isoform X1 n=1 Tax=Pistacia vera TaxID=55513 RepID=UPI00126326B3|nr:uncharacterized protein LOC116136362 isoform X1 [Pistacia vera]XP_031277925.1 uncharacterized protein LOC116136362 isoform X1 [Pistacia vera]XP_031277926.1 uncharacterized protein LOC116136362 isoform X1 [Pistacia vera]XP_031277927.1 uncharacterized protein LOC116136362 isoform X1 [Pistacia vera]XP_031277928.1 uncharacterized protein LOC116136362 isoform X1 [Pistacia vera]